MPLLTNVNKLNSIKTYFMSSIFRPIILCLVIFIPVATLTAQINSMNKPKNSVQPKANPGNPTIQSGQQGNQSMQNKQGPQSSTSGKTISSMGGKAMINYPVP